MHHVCIIVYTTDTGYSMYVGVCRCACLGQDSVTTTCLAVVGDRRAAASADANPNGSASGTRRRSEHHPRKTLVGVSAGWDGTGLPGTASWSSSFANLGGYVSSISLGHHRQGPYFMTSGPALHRARVCGWAWARNPRSTRDRAGDSVCGE